MDLETLRAHLAQAERHVARAAQHVAEQRKHVAELERNGRCDELTEAWRFLESLENMQAMHVWDRDRIAQEIAKLYRS